VSDVVRVGRFIEVRSLGRSAFCQQPTGSINVGDFEDHTDGEQYAVRMGPTCTSRYRLHWVDEAGVAALSSLRWAPETRAARAVVNVGSTAHAPANIALNR
jgi:hypothetical protein